MANIIAEHCFFKIYQTDYYNAH